MSKEYLQKQKESGLKVGSRVVIIRGATDGENGWENSWADSMSNRVGTCGTIREIRESRGIKIDFDDGVLDSCVYPHFVLMKLNEEENPNIKQRLNVWCKNISADTEKVVLLTEIVKNHPIFKNYTFDKWTEGRNNFFIIEANHGNFIGFYTRKEGCFADSKTITEEQLFEILGHTLKYKPFYLEFNIGMRFQKIA